MFNVLNDLVPNPNSVGRVESTVHSDTDYGRALHSTLSDLSAGLQLAMMYECAKTAY